MRLHSQRFVDNIHCIRAWWNHILDTVTLSGVNVEKSYIDKLQTLQNRASRIVTRVSYEDADHAMLLRKLVFLR